MQRQRNARGAGGRLRSEIIDAATCVLAGQRENEVFSLRAVAARANISAPSVYLHFEDKAALLLAVSEQLYDEFTSLRDEADAVITSAGGGPWERLLARCLAYVRFALERPGHYKVLYEGRAVPRVDAFQVAPFEESLLSRTADLVRELYAIQGPAIDEPDRVALLLWASLHGVVSLQTHRASIDWPIAQELTEQILRALTRPAQKSVTTVRESSMSRTLAR